MWPPDDWQLATDDDWQLTTGADWPRPSERSARDRRQQLGCQLGQTRKLSCPLASSVASSVG